MRAIAHASSADRPVATTSYLWRLRHTCQFFELNLAIPTIQLGGHQQVQYGIFSFQFSPEPKNDCLAGRPLTK